MSSSIEDVKHTSFVVNGDLFAVRVYTGEVTGQMSVQDGHSLVTRRTFNSGVIFLRVKVRTAPSVQDCGATYVHEVVLDVLDSESGFA